MVAVTDDLLDEALYECFGKEDGRRTLGQRMFAYLADRSDPALPDVGDIARALHLRGIACSPFRGSVVVSPSGASPLDRVVPSCEPGYHRPAAESIVSALRDAT